MINNVAEIIQNKVSDIKVQKPVENDCVAKCVIL
jgi:hypothetical protein